MRKLLLSVVLAVQLFFIGLAGSVNATTLKEAGDATFKLYQADKGICTANFVGHDKDGELFLTAAHCVVGSADQRMSLNLRKRTVDKADAKTVLSEQVYYVKVIRDMPKKDVALLQIRDSAIKLNVEPIEIASVEEASSVEFGSALLGIGYPKGTSLSLSQGAMAELVPSPFDGLDAIMYQTTVTLAQGNSGGGLYAKIGDEYKLIGTATGMRTDTSIITYYQTAESINEVLRGFVTSYKEPSPAKPTAGSADER